MFLYIGKPVPESPPGTAPHRSGNVLLSQAVPRQVSSTRKSLTTVFGMGTGGSSLLSSPEYIVCSWLPPLAAIGKIPLGAPPLVLLRRTGIFLPLLRSARVPAHSLLERTLHFKQTSKILLPPRGRRSLAPTRIFALSILWTLYPQN